MAWALSPMPMYALPITRRANALSGSSCSTCSRIGRASSNRRSRTALLARRNRLKTAMKSLGSTCEGGPEAAWAVAPT